VGVQAVLKRGVEGLFWKVMTIDMLEEEPWDMSMPDMSSPEEVEVEVGVLVAKGLSAIVADFRCGLNWRRIWSFDSCCNFVASFEVFELEYSVDLVQ
jgi:hypothetical protein